jgi:hypothetical protein
MRVIHLEPAVYFTEDLQLHDHRSLVGKPEVGAAYALRAFVRVNISRDEVFVDRHDRKIRGQRRVVPFPRVVSDEQRRWVARAFARLRHRLAALVNVELDVRVGRQQERFTGFAKLETVVDPDRLPGLDCRNHNVEFAVFVPDIPASVFLVRDPGFPEAFLVDDRFPVGASLVA